MRYEIRQATRDDSPAIYRLVRELAVFEELEHKVRASEQDIAEMGFGERPYFHCLLAEEVAESGERQALGFALYVHNFSTFEGRPGIYLEDLFVSPSARGAGLGRTLLARLARICREQDFRRLDLSVLHWNPARQFYERIGMSHQEEWLGYRLEGDELERLAGEAEAAR